MKEALRICTRDGQATFLAFKTHNITVLATVKRMPCIKNGGKVSRPILIAK
jgi:hypothetical protein